MRRLRLNPIVWVLVFTAVALCLGYVGFRSSPGPRLNRSDAVFSSLQLFALEGSVHPEGTPWQLNLARFLAPLTVVYATVMTIMTLLREHLQRTLIRLIARDHVVVVGLGRSGALLATSLRQRDQQVVAVESNSSNQRITAVRAHGVRVITGDATHPVILQRARASRALHVIITTGDDSLNLEIAERARALAVPESRNRPTTVHVAVSDENLWMELARLHLGRAESGVVLEFFNEVDRAAQTLLNEAERGVGLPSLTNVIVEGEGALAQRLLMNLVRRVAGSGGCHPSVHVSPSTASSVLTPILEREAWMEGAADFYVEDVRIRGESAVVAFVAGADSDASSIARALGLLNARACDTVYVAVQGQQANALLVASGKQNRIHLVPVDFRALSEEFLLHSGRELMARVRHEDYLAREFEKGVTAEDNPSLVRWEDLPDALKESNRRFAEAVAEVIDSLGGQLTPLRELTGDATVFADGELLERLAESEHDRWVAALRAGGWRYSPGRKNPEAKTHPLIVAWSELPDAEKEKDRDAIRAVPRMLARVGYQLEVAGPTTKGYEQDSLAPRLPEGRNK